MTGAARWLFALSLALLPLGVCALALAPGDHRFELRHDEQIRQYLIYVPAQPTQPPTVILALHGATFALHRYREQSQLDQLADRTGAILIYPLGLRYYGPRLWNAGSCCTGPLGDTNDVGFIDAVLDDAAMRLAVSTEQVFVTGMSNGAMMAYRYASARPRVAALAAVAGYLPAGDAIEARPLSILHIQSEDDPLLPAGGRRLPGMDLPPVETALRPWREAAGCPAEAAVTHRLAQPGAVWGRDRAIRKRWGPCSAGAEIVLWRLSGVSHVWPGGDPPFLLSLMPIGGTDLLDANEVIWDFFQGHRPSSAQAGLP